MVRIMQMVGQPLLHDVQARPVQIRWHILREIGDAQAVKGLSVPISAML